MTCCENVVNVAPLFANMDMFVLSQFIFWPKVANVLGVFGTLIIACQNMILLSAKHRCVIFGTPLLVRVLCLLLSILAFLERVVSLLHNKNQVADWDSQNPTPPCPTVESANFAPASASLLPSGWGKSAILEAGLSRSCETRLSWQRNGMRKDTRYEQKCFPLLKC